jgi:Concanavalin A-like lectin/glucanases superfamily
MKKFILSLFLCLLCPASYADVSTGLVGWWKLIDGSGTTCLDSSGNANTGTTHNTPTWVAGHIGSFALNFVSASNQYVNTAAATNIPNINASQTLSAWVNIPSTAAVYDIVVPELNGSGANQLRISGGDIQVSQWGGAVTITGGAVSINTWHMLTWTYNSVGPVSTVYIDGVQSGATSATATQAFTPTAVYIGSYGAGAGNENFNGIIDDVRIYNRVLSAADVAQLFQYTGNRGFFTVIDR